jgi:hypothetical protein
LDYLAGREVAAVVYHRNKHIINLFIWPSESGRLAAVQAFAMIRKSSPAEALLAKDRQDNKKKTGTIGWVEKRPLGASAKACPSCVNYSPSSGLVGSPTIGATGFERGPHAVD